MWSIFYFLLVRSNLFDVINIMDQLTFCRMSRWSYSYDYISIKNWRDKRALGKYIDSELIWLLCEYKLLFFFSLVWNKEETICHQVNSHIPKDRGCRSVLVRTWLAWKMWLGVLSGEVYIRQLLFVIFYLFIFKSQRGELNGMMGNIIPEANKG